MSGLTNLYISRKRMINEDFRRYWCNGRGYRPARNAVHFGIDLGGIVWADSTVLLWLALVMADGSWNLVAHDVP